jgi:hypothetical protein
MRSYSRFSRPEPLLFHSSNSSIILTRLSGPRSRPTTSQKNSGSAGNQTWVLWICSRKLWPLDHRGGLSVSEQVKYSAAFKVLLYSQDLSLTWTTAESTPHLTFILYKSLIRVWIHQAVSSIQTFPLNCYTHFSCPYATFSAHLVCLLLQKY